MVVAPGLWERSRSILESCARLGIDKVPGLESLDMDSDYVQSSEAFVTRSEAVNGLAWMQFFFYSLSFKQQGTSNNIL
jgi:hypothetical protein